MGPRINELTIVLGLRYASPLLITIGFLVASCLTLLARRQARKVRNGTRLPQGPKVMAVGPIEADTIETKNSDRTTGSDARGAEQDRESSIASWDEHSSTAPGGGSPDAETTGEIRDAMSPRETDNGATAAERLTEATPDLVAPLVEIELSERVVNANALEPENARHYGEMEPAEELAVVPDTLDEQENEQLVDEADEIHLEAATPTEGDGHRARYRAPRLPPETPRARKPTTSSSREREQVLDVRVRCISDRHGFCRFHLLGQRLAGSLADVEARNGRRAIRLSEAADDWYEISELPELSTVIEHGARFSSPAGDEVGQTWGLSGRDLYVLAPLHGVLGFVSTTRLCIGREQIVLCREGRGVEVEAILAEAGCVGLHAHGAEMGSPAGWVFFRPVTPSRPVPQAPDDNILNVIRPLPDIEVLLEGGLWLRDSIWIAGYPPRVRVTGELPAGTSVTIDGQVAEADGGSEYRARDSDGVGAHIVWCGGRSASYSICEPSEDWERWEAHTFSRGSVCGALSTQASNLAEVLTTLPTGNPILIGANPGEIFRCDARPGKQWTGFTPFPVCWALPTDPLHCDRGLRRVLLIRPVSPAHFVVSGFTKKRVARNVLQWCSAIRDCKQKRLGLSPANAASEQLWKEYSTEAKATWRAMR